MKQRISRRTFLLGMAALPLISALPQGREEGKAMTIDVRALVREASSKIQGKKVVAIIPDSTRSGGKHIGEGLRGLYDAKAVELEKLVALVALGTHGAMALPDILKYLCISKEEHLERMPKLAFLNHEWGNPSAFAEVGTVSAREWLRLSGGAMDLREFRRGEGVKVRFNKIAAEADDIVIMGPVIPHEVVGCSGGLKYCSPGIGDPELTGCTHWLGAALTIPEVIGRIATPVREVITHCVSLMRGPRKHALTLVPDGETLRGAYFGSAEEAYLQAAKLTVKVNIEYTGRRYKKVLALLDPRYDELWTGGKGSYKLIQLVEPGGKLVIYAPHLSTISRTWGRGIESVGYHCLDFIKARLGDYLEKGINPCVLAHVTHVYGPGTCENGIETPSAVHLATGLSAETCKKINLRYIDPAVIDIEAWRKDPDTYVADHAGERLVLPGKGPV
ncbi:MAG: lactate racemase domain-containing protein [Candidatus Eremiobacteraeota bacterium]|nr:lactate racemase domain-containing protein [Candidatus Eremiobacteraeota bacterium]